MPVKRSQSGSRVLTALETIAHNQPIGVRALARLMDEDKSAVQRALKTLADEGWIRICGEPPARWELTARIIAVASAAQGNDDLRRRARPILERLRDESGETVLLSVPDLNRFVVVDVIESRQMLRMVPEVGTPVSPRRTATGRAILPFLNHERQMAMLGEAPDQSLLAGFAGTRRDGYAISAGETNPDATNIAAPIFAVDGQPVGAVVVCAPSERLQRSQYDAIGRLTEKAAREISRSAPSMSPSSRSE